MVVCGTGLIGGEIALYLKRTGHDVTLGSRTPTTVPGLADMPFLQRDYIKDNRSDGHLKGFDWLVFSAAADIRNLPQDGSVTPEDLGMQWCVGYKKPYSWIGRRALSRPDTQREDRKQLVGLLTEDGSKLEEGAQIVLDPNQPKPMKMVGHVTSSYDCGTLGHPVALAVIEGGHDRMGETVYLPMPGRVQRAKITSTVFYDPEGERLKA